MATANFGKIQIGIYVEIKRSDGELRRRPCRLGPASDVHGGEAGAGRLIDCSAGLWGRKGGGRGAFVCGVCASEAGVGSAWRRCSAAGGEDPAGLGREEAGGEGPGGAGLVSGGFGRRGGGPGPAASRSSRGLHPPGSGGGGLGSGDPASYFTPAFSSSGLIFEAVGAGRAWRPVISVFREPTAGQRPRWGE